MRMQTPTKRFIGSLVCAALLAILAWIDSHRFQESGQVMIGRERQILEGIPALTFVYVTAAGALSCLLYSARQALLILRGKNDRPPEDRA